MKKKTDNKLSSGTNPPLVSYSWEETADRMAIMDLYAHYVHAVDDHQLDVLNGIFLPETSFDLGEHGKFVWGNDPENGTQADYRRNWAKYAVYFHLCGSIRIDFDSEARTSAHVKSKTINPVGTSNPRGGIDLVVDFVDYTDELVKLGSVYGGWRIKSRKGVSILLIKDLEPAGKFSG